MERNKKRLTFTKEEIDLMNSLILNENTYGYDAQMKAVALKYKDKFRRLPVDESIELSCDELRELIRQCGQNEAWLVMDVDAEKNYIKKMELEAKLRICWHLTDKFTI